MNKNQQALLTEFVNQKSGRNEPCQDFAKEVSGGLTQAEADFEARRHLIDLLDVRVTLAIEDGQKVAYVRCLVDETELRVASTTH